VSVKVSRPTPVQHITQAYTASHNKSKQTYTSPAYNPSLHSIT